MTPPTPTAAGPKSARIATVNPTTGELVRSFPADTPVVIEAKLAAAREAREPWAHTPLGSRAALLERIAGLLDDDRNRLAALMTLEMGKPIGAARDEVAKCALGCRLYAEHAAAWLRPELVDGPDQMIQFAPLGVILAVMPWNFPLWQVFRFAAPALVAGNVALLKHASNVPQCALAIAELIERAGAPVGIFQTLLVGSAAVEAVIADDSVAAVTLTGSGPAGRAVAATAGRHLKKSLLELGGSDPFVVLADADVAAAAATAVKARVVNNGQSCIAAKRFIVAAPIHDAFVAAFADHMRGLRVGDPADEATDVGPLATAAIRDELDAQVRASVAAGARVLVGGNPLPGPGFFYAPTILVDVPRSAPAARDELFGPVAAVFRVADADAALRLANDSPFGLGASLWTRDRGTVERFARDVQSGCLFVNGMVASDPRFPFGGVKQSGYGRELSRFGLLEWVNIKTVRAFGLS